MVWLLVRVPNYFDTQASYWPVAEIGPKGFNGRRPTTVHEEINSHMSPKFPNLKFKCDDHQVVNSTIHGYC